MITRVRTVVRFLLQPTQKTRVAQGRRHTACAYYLGQSGRRRKAARTAVTYGIATFALLTVAMAAAVDTVLSRWRDPEFTVRLSQLENWKATRPQRPLVVAFGSSRTQMGLSPAAMGFADEPGSPVIYNFGYRGSPPLGSYLHFTRILDSGLKPDAILFQLAPIEVRVLEGAERQLGMWAPRLAAGDVHRLAPYSEDENYWRLAWVKCHLAPVLTYQQAVLSELLAAWLSQVQSITYIWERMDPYGFSFYWPEQVSDDDRNRLLRDSKRHHADNLASSAPTSEIALRVCRDLVSRCRAEGISVAFYWPPESPTYLSWHSPAFRAGTEAFGQRLEMELGVPVFPAPTHLGETDFADGFHLIKTGAEKYSRWLADTHLKPWLRAQGLAK